MVRVMGEPGDPSTHVENRVGEPLANPYLYMASQIYAGLDRIARKREPGPSADAPYARSDAEVLADNSGRALVALRTNKCFRSSFGNRFVDYYTHLKEAEIARAREELKDMPDECDVTEWDTGIF